MKKLLILTVLGVVVLTSSCSDDDSCLEKQNKESSIILDENNAKKEFSLALHKALTENVELRKLIKDEASRKIDYDYDVLYSLIKDTPLNNGKTVEELFSTYIGMDTLLAIGEQYPTLTIFVPELPLNTFSAERWDYVKENPAVSYISSKHTGDIPVILPSGEEDIIEGDKIPAYPILVVKTNERIILNNSLKSINGNEISLANSGYINGTSFSFTDKAFDNLHKKKVYYDRDSIEPNMQKVFYAYHHFNTTGWQRDYIYYDQTPTQRDGVLDNKYYEAVVGFEMVPDGLGDLEKISGSDETDTYPVPGISGNPGQAAGNLWTDGEFEFNVIITIGSSDDSPNVIVKPLRIKGDELFNLAYKGENRNGLSYMTLKYATPKRVIMNQTLFQWNLKTYSPSASISVKEIDDGDLKIYTYKGSIEFAGNVSYNPALNKECKQGLGEGGAERRTVSNTFTLQYTDNSDDLGNFLINFDDPVIVSDKMDSVKYYSIHETYQEPSSGGRITKSISDGSGRGGSSDSSSGGRSSDYYYVPKFNPNYNTGFYKIYISPVQTI